MFEFLGHAIYRARWWVVIAAGVFAALAGVWAAGTFSDLVGGGFTYANSDSAKAADLERRTLGRDDADVVVVFRSSKWTVDDTEFERAASQILTALPADKIDGVTDYWSSRLPNLVSADRHVSYAAIQVAGVDEETKADNYLAIRDKLASPELATTVGGPLAMFNDVNAQSKDDLAKAEALALPILFILLILIFRNFAAACLPVLVGVLAIVGSLAGLRSLTLFTDVSIFAVNVVTLLGLGLAIDYSLFMVNRFREELGRCHPTPEAIRRTMVTAGRTIAVSAVTVGLALSSLLVFPQVFLRSIGLGGITAVFLAAVFAMTVMPALLAILGHRVGEWRHRDATPTTDRGAWERIAHAVMRRPVLVAVGVVAVLIALGLPFLRISYGWLDTRVLPPTAQSRQAEEILERSFPRNVTSPIEAIVTLPRSIDSPEERKTIVAYQDRVRAVAGVSDVELTGAKGATARVAAYFTAEPISERGRALVNAVRSVPPPPGGQVLVGGNAARFADLMNMISKRLPWMALIGVLTTFVLLFLAFGSFVLPIKALLMNVLSLSAAFGAVVLIFQDGNLTSLLDFTSTGNIDVVQPILILAIAFGLSMDYEVFLLSRIREQYDLTGDNREAVATGLQRTGRIITSAALLLVIVIGSFATSQVLVVKIVGIGLAIAIIIDATVVRALLVPATMRLLGHFNWWAPRWARPLYSRWGVRENEARKHPMAAAGSTP